jgi:hypothetical protein
MQLVPVQHGQGQNTIEVRFDLLLAFTKHMCQMTVCGDQIVLAVMAAQRDIEATEEEVRALLKAAMSEKVNNSIWPEGF